MFASPLIFPRTSEMLISNFPEMGNVCLCKKLKDIDKEEENFQISNPDSEKLARYIVKEYDTALYDRFKHVLISTAFTVGSLALTLHAPSLTSLWGGTSTFGFAGVVVCCYRWSFTVDRINAQAKARGIGKSRIKRIHEKINKISLEMINTIGEERRQLELAKKHLSGSYEKFSKMYKDQKTVVHFMPPGGYRETEDYKKDKYIKTDFYPAVDIPSQSITVTETTLIGVRTRTVLFEGHRGESQTIVKEITYPPI